MLNRWPNLLRWAMVPLAALWTGYAWKLYLPKGVPHLPDVFTDLSTLPSPLVFKPWWLDLLAAGGLAFAALCVGGWLLARLSMGWSHGERLLLATSTGLTVLILASASLALAGMFTTKAVYLLAALFLLAAVPRIPAELDFLGECAARAGQRILAEPEAGLFLILAAPFFFFGLVAAAIPETSSDGLNVHLYYPRLFLERGAFYAADLYRSTSPLYTQVLYAVGLAFRGPGLARFLNFLLLPGLALAVLLFTRRLAQAAGARGQAAGSLAVLFLVSAPTVLYHSTVCLPDLAQVFWSFLALHVLFRFVETESRAWLVLGGVFGGMAAGSKYAGLYAAVVLAALLGAGAWQRRWGWRRAARIVILFGFIVLAVSSPWYLRNWYFTGDPLHPMFYKLVTRPAIDPIEARDILVDAMNYRRFPATARNVISLPWLITTKGDRLQGTIGPVFLWCLPIILLATRKDWNWLAALFAATALSLFFFSGPHWMRYFLPVAPVLCGLSAASLTLRGRRWLLPVAVVLSLVNLPGLNQDWVGGGHNVLPGVRYDVAFGPTTFEQYQQQLIPGFETVRHWNGLDLPAGTRILPVPPFEFFASALSRWPVVDIFENGRVVCQDEKGAFVGCYTTPPGLVRRKIDEHRIGMLAIRHNLDYLSPGGALRLEDPLLRSDFRFVGYQGGTFLFQRRPNGPDSGTSYVNADLLYRWVNGPGAPTTEGSVTRQPVRPWAADSRAAMVFGPAARLRYEVDLGRQPRLSVAMTGLAPHQVTLRADAAGRSLETTCKGNPAPGWEPCSLDLALFSGMRAAITLSGASVAVAGAVIWAQETGEPVADTADPFPFIPSSREHPVVLRFTPEKVRAGFAASRRYAAGSRRRSH